MPLYNFRLESTEGEFRQGSIFADSKDEARRILEEREHGYAVYRLTTEELAAAEKDVTAPANRSKLALHRQAEPYKLVSLEVRKGG